jgi:hypothetical protein
LHNCLTMTPRDFVRTAIAIRLQSGGPFATAPHSADVVEVPSTDGGRAGQLEFVTARIAVWSERGRVKGQLLEVLR